jgi:hypothetical protein
VHEALADRDGRWRRRSLPKALQFESHLRNPLDTDSDFIDSLAESLHSRVLFGGKIDESAQRYRDIVEFVRDERRQGIGLAELTALSSPVLHSFDVQFRPGLAPGCGGKPQFQ